MPSDFPLLPALDGKALNLADAQTCAACRFWFYEAKRSAGAGVGDVAPCRRFPPVVVLAPNLKPGIGEPPVMPSALPHVMTQAGGWCGEFSREVTRPRK